MAADGDGFLSPRLERPEECVHCGLCQRACPVLNAPAVRAGEVQGFAAYTSEPLLREESSSGGIFSALALPVLADGGAVYGAAYDDCFAVHHICVEQAEELAKLRGAKYAQSTLGSTFREVKARLIQGQQVLFSGTPCQVAGLKSFLRKDYDNLLTVDFVCHGVPSPMAWQSYVRFRAKEDNDGQLPERINLRSKESGWSRYTYSNVFSYPGGHRHTASSGDSLFMRLFVGDYINRESCSNCRFKGYDRVSDVTLGDFWGIWNIAPEMDDNQGTSLVLLHSEKGRQLFSRIQSGIVCKSVPLELTSQENPALLVSSEAKPQRGEVLELLRREDFETLQTRFPKPVPCKPTLFVRIKSKIKGLIAR